MLDGADAVMLSGEVANGKYPVKSVQVMARVSEQADIASQKYSLHPRSKIKTISEVRVLSSVE